jgi:predicted ATPase
MVRLGPLPQTDVAALVTAMLGSPPGETLQKLTARAAGILTGSDPDLAFRHLLIQQALYESMPAALRTALHAEAAPGSRRAAPPPAGGRAQPGRAAGAALPADQPVPAADRN